MDFVVGNRGKSPSRAQRTRGRTDLASDARGATLVEFALVAAPLIALLLAILQTSFVYFAQQSLETTAEAASRILMTGQAQQGGYNQAKFKQSVCGVLSIPLQCSNLMIDITQAATFSGANTGKPTITYDKYGNITNTWSYSPGGARTIVVLKLMYIWPVQVGPLNFDLSNSGNGKRLLVATSVFETEPYS